MRIAICDDESLDRMQLRRMAADYFSTNHINCAIDEFATGHSFVDMNNRYDLVFMDYRLSDGNGIDFVRELRQVNERIFVVFLTWYDEHALEAIQLDTFRYLIKPISAELLTEALESFVRLYQRNRKIIVPTPEKTLFLDADDVMYLEADKKYTTVRTVNGQYRSSKSISDFYSEINNSHFFRTHRSYIVNMKYVSSIEGKTILLQNGEKVICSAKNYDEFLKNYMSYLKFES